MFGVSFDRAGFYPQPQVGSYVALDGWTDGSNSTPHSSGDYLEACTDWDKASFRLPCTSLRVPCAVNVGISGRTIQIDSSGNEWVRVKVTFVGDGEDDTDTHGWMLIR